MKYRLFSGKKLMALQVALIIFIAAISPKRIKAQQSQNMQLSLKSAQEYAVQHNYNARNFKMDITAAKRRIKEAFTSGLPKFTSSFTYNNNLSLATSLIPNFF